MPTSDSLWFSLNLKNTRGLRRTCRPNSQPRTRGANCACTVSGTDLEERRRSLTCKVKIPHYMPVLDLSICICFMLNCRKWQSNSCLCACDTGKDWRVRRACRAYSETCRACAKHTSTWKGTYITDRRDVNIYLYLFTEWLISITCRSPPSRWLLNI